MAPSLAVEADAVVGLSSSNGGSRLAGWRWWRISVRGSVHAPSAYELSISAEPRTERDNVYYRDMQKLGVS
jgi:hypothetical protein